MNEATKKTTETEIQEVKSEAETEIVEAEVVFEKPYEFRKLSSPDIFPMLRIIGKIGLKEFTAAIDKNVLMELIAEFTAENAKGNEEATEGAEGAENAKGNILGTFAVNGATVILGIADVIISKLPSCENDIYHILSQTSNLSVDEIKALDAAVFFGMVIDFIMKEEFKDFIKVVSGLLK